MNKILRICKGNTFALKIDVEKLKNSNGSIVKEDFNLQTCKEIKVLLSSKGKTIEAEFTAVGKTLTIKGDKGYEVGMYDLELVCVDADDLDLRFSKSGVFSIVRNTEEADIPVGVEFGIDNYYLGVISVTYATSVEAVTSVGASVPTGFKVSGSPITGSGIIAISFAEGYSLPTTSKQAEWDAKQDKLTAGENVTITNGVISATDTKIPDSKQAEWSGKQDKLIEGDNIEIDSQNKISADLSSCAKNSDITDLQDEIDANASDIDALEGEVDAIKTRTTTAEGNISTLQGKVSSLETSVAGKQDTLTAGANVTIEGGVISATDTKIPESKQTEWSNKQDKLTAGTNITIENNVISSSATPISPEKQAEWDAKQDKLIAGSNITIVGNTISATGGGSGGSIIYKGTIGTGGTITTLPTASTENTGWQYKVITAGTYSGIEANINDSFISNGSTWTLTKDSEDLGKIGDLNDLTTSVKTSVVDAINEVNANKLEASTQVSVKTSTSETKKTITQIGLLNDALITNSYLQSVIDALSNGWKGLKFTALEPNSTVAAEPSYNFEYSNDLGKTWNSLSNTPIKVSPLGMWVRGDGFNNKENASNPGFLMTGKIASSGSIMSLLDKIGESEIISKPNQFYRMFAGCTSLVSAPELPATTLAAYCYLAMFAGCTSLVSAPELPATTLAGSCYNSMFAVCTSLVSAPELPATTLAGSCYNSMFYGCTSLVSAPELPATTLAVYCYLAMFNGCTSLVSAPELPATTLTNNCYYSMFNGCTSLVSAPELPATTLAQNCYKKMFSMCSSLNNVKIYATDISATECMTEWLSQVASSGTLTCPADLGLPNGTSGLPNGWKRIDLE